MPAKLEAPLSEPRRSSAGFGCLAVFCFLFAAAGATLFYFAFVLPLARTLAARGWETHSCRVISSRVVGSSSSDGTTYRVEIVYVYEAGGSSRTSDRYDFFGGSSSGRDRKQRIVERYPVYSVTPCYVDPADPGQAVLSRALTPFYLLGLIPLGIALVATAGMIGALRAGRRDTARAAGKPLPVATRGAAATAGGRGAGGAAGPVELSPAVTPLGKLAGFLFLTLFWNGIVSVFVWQVFVGLRRSRPEGGCLALFLVPFVAVGLGLIWATGRQLLSLASPRPRLTLSAAVLPLGEPVLLQWRFTGRVALVSRLLITLEGREEASYRRGTDTVTDRQPFLLSKVVETPYAERISTGSGSIRVPADTMPSWTGEHNKIVWALKVKAEIAGWPDVEEEYPITVIPPPPSGWGR